MVHARVPAAASDLRMDHSGPVGDVAAAENPLFPGFEPVEVLAGDVTIRGVRGGSGPPVLLLHGFPQTHAIWHRVAPKLARDWTVVATDLTGYGSSSKPPGGPDHHPYTKRAMALAQHAVMTALGFPRFHVVGHDRGGRVGHRLALDVPEAVASLTVLDIAPTLAMYRGTTEAFARAYWHWFFLIRPAPIPERMIGADPLGYLRQHMARGPAGLDLFDPQAFAAYEAAFTPETIHAACEDYRASAGPDLVLDEADHGQRRIAGPLLALWGREGAVGRCFDVLRLWREWADDVTGEPMPCGHYIPEEQPELLVGRLEAFWAAFLA